MKNIQVAIFTLAIAHISCSQVVVSEEVEFDNVKVFVSNDGRLFNNSTAGISGYEIPKGAETRTIYSLDFWFGGILQNGDLGFSKTGSTLDQRDVYAGPYADSSYLENNYTEMYDTAIWKVNQTDVNNYRNWWMKCIGPDADPYLCNSIPLDEIPNNMLLDEIYNWPAHGNLENGENYYLAPFWGLEDGIYQPIESGDYPYMKGCNSVFMIMNDDNGSHNYSNANQLDLEIRYIVYQMSGDDDIGNTTFIELQIYNHSNDTIYDFKISNYVDFDLGYGADDYLGCDPQRNLMYVYNGDNVDETNGSQNGYDVNPPTCGIVCLTDNVTSIKNFNSFLNTPMEHWNLMNGLNPDGSPTLNDEGQVTQFMYSENPNDQNSYSEHQIGNPPGDRRGVMTISIGNLPPATYDNLMFHQTVSYGIVYSRTGNYLENVNSLFEATEDVQAYFENEDLYCGANSLQLNDLSNNISAVSVYPNPTNGVLNVTCDSNEKLDVAVISMLGQVVGTFELNGSGIIDCSNFDDGIYSIYITRNEQILTSRFVKTN